MSQVLIKEVDKPEKVCLCRECGGTGYIGGDNVSSDVVWPMGKTLNVCPQCGGSGRVYVSAHIRMTIRRY